MPTIRMNRAIAAGVLLLATTRIRRVTGWTQFAQPLTVATPNQQGLYEFDLLVKYRITMTTESPHEQLNMVDYDADSGTFQVRSPDPFNNATSAVTDTNSLSGLIQHNGLHYRILTINGESPGRPVVVPFNATVILRVINEATIAITLHMHGLNNEWFRDGVANLQHCAIAPRSIYSYRFTAGVPGTHWFHGHLGTDRSEGLLAPLIVLPQNATQTGVTGQNPLGREYVAILQHWTKISISELNMAKQTRIAKWSYGFDDHENVWADHRGYDGMIAAGSSPIIGFMVNDKGWYNQDDITQRPHNLSLESFRIGRGETIRLRIINGGISEAMMVSIENHQMTIVAADGIELQPLASNNKADMLILYPGERYDVLLSGQSSPLKKTNYIIFENLDYTDNKYAKISPTYALAKLMYEDVSNESNELPDFIHRNCTSSSPCRIVNCPFQEMPNREIFHCINMDVLRNREPIIDSEILLDDGNIRSFQEAVMGLQFSHYVNGYNYMQPRAPPYFYPEDETNVATPCVRERCQHLTDAVFDENCRCFHHINLTLGSVVQEDDRFYTVSSQTCFMRYDWEPKKLSDRLTIAESGPIEACVAHPIHMHGTHFYVMKIGYPNYDSNNRLLSYNDDIVCDTPNATTCNQPQWRNSSWSNGRVPGMNTRDPPLRDTIVIPAGGYAVIRFRATNPGWYYVHCHYVFHALGGMSFAMRIGDRDQMPAPPSGFPRGCGVFEDSGRNGEETVSASPRSHQLISISLCLYVYFFFYLL